MKVVETILARGHENITATHKTTFEITKEESLTKRGDCIIAVSANKTMPDFKSEFKKALKNENAKLIIEIKAGEIREIVRAYGSSQLQLTHPTDMVIRKSSYICNRTLAIKADKAAADLSRSLVEKLRKPKQNVEIKLIAII